jgi:hypothetical protein
MSQEFDDLTANLLTPKGRKKAPSRMSLSGFLGRQSNYQVEDKGQVESRSKPRQSLKKMVSSALGLRPPLKTDGIDNKIVELTGILEIYENNGFSYTNGKDNHTKILTNLRDQIAGYESYKNNIRNATTLNKGTYILDFQKLEEKLKVLQKMEKLYNLENWLEYKRYSDEKKKVVSLIFDIIKVSMETLKTLENLDTFIEHISDDDYDILKKYITKPLQKLNESELDPLFKKLAKWFLSKDRTTSEMALLLVELYNILPILKEYREIKSERKTVNKLKDVLISKIKDTLVNTDSDDAYFINALEDLGYLLEEDILQFEELLKLELLTDDILTIKDLDEILPKEDLQKLNGMLKNYEHSKLKDLQKLKDLYDVGDELLIKILNNVEYQVSGGRKASVKKEICGKLRCIYTIAGSRKEHVKYKGRLITVADYKRIHKIRKV